MRWAASSPSMICSTQSTASPIGNGPRARTRSCNVPPGTNSIAMTGVPPISSVPKDIDAVGMVDRGGQPPLAEESLARVGRIERVAQDLERYAATAFQVLGLIDRAHAARRPARG